MNFLVRSEDIIRSSVAFNFKTITIQILLVLIIGVLSCETGQASSPGAFDLTFGVAGMNLKDLGYDRQQAKAVAVQPDGKIVMVGVKGNHSPANYDFVVFRYNTDGSFDTSFGTNGMVFTDFNGENEEANAVAIQPDGKIVVAGSLGFFGSAPTAFKLARYMPDGSLDSSFGTGGKVNSGFLDYAARVNSMILQPDGKIVVAGDDLNPNLLLSRFNTDGSLDTSFDGDGQVIITNPGLNFGSLGRQSDGKLVVAGNSFNATDSFTVYRFNTNGSIDTNFGTGGKVSKTYTFNSVFYRVVNTKLAVQPDDKIIVSGDFNSDSQSFFYNEVPPLARLNADGSFDSGFIPNTSTTRPVSCNLCTSLVDKILPLPDGKFYLVGFLGEFTTNIRGISISRYLSNGTFDNSFGYRGTRNLSKIDWVYAINDAALQADGKIIIAATGSTTRIESGNITYNYLAIRLNAAVNPPTPRSDFDGDHRADFAVFRPSNRNWYILNSTDNSFSFIFYGLSTDTLVPGDYNYDGKTDVAIFRSSSNGWWIKPSQPGNGIYSSTFGTANDVPSNGDYDGDGFTDLAVFRPSNGTWYLRYSSLTQNLSYVAVIPFGLNGDKPVPGDYDGDGLTDVAVFRPSTGVWWIQRSSDNQAMTAQWGLSTDKPVQADYDGDGRTDVSVFRDGIWYVIRSSDGSFAILQWGLSDDIPAPGDFDGDNKTDFAVFRPSEGNWYVIKSSDSSYLITHWGQNGDIPIPVKYLP